MSRITKRVLGTLWSLRRDLREWLQWVETGELLIRIQTTSGDVVQRNDEGSLIWFTLTHRNAVMLHKRLGQAIEFRRKGGDAK